MPDLDDTLQTVACRFCKAPTPMTGTKLCDPCWEVDKRIDWFVRSQGGRDRVRQALVKVLQDETIEGT